MGGWKELLIDIIKLTDEVKRLDQDTGNLSRSLTDIDKRVVRLETIIEIGKAMSTRPAPPAIDK